MRPRRASSRVVFWLAASCWLAAGPGGVVVRAVLACRHAAMHMASSPGHAGHGGPHMPSDGPCFCSQMVGGFDHVLSVAMPAVEPVRSLIVAPGMALRPSSPFPLPPSPLFAPETPPPIVA